MWGEDKNNRRVGEWKTLGINKTHFILSSGKMSSGLTRFSFQMNIVKMEK
jgi:hypothetical protein